MILYGVLQKKVGVINKQHATTTFRPTLSPSTTCLLENKSGSLQFISPRLQYRPPCHYHFDHLQNNLFRTACVLYRVFSHDVTAAILVSQNNETAAMLVSQTSPVGVELFSYANPFFCSNKFARMLAT